MAHGSGLRAQGSGLRECTMHNAQCTLTRHSHQGTRRTGAAGKGTENLRLGA
jgi:hypothetical protein